MNELKQKLKKLILLSGDIALLYLSLYLVLRFRYGTIYTPDVFHQHFYPFTVTYAFWLIVFYINNFYALDYARNTYKFYASIIKSFLFNSVLSIFFFYITFFSIGISPKTNLLLNILLFAALFTAWRISYNFFVKTKTFSINTLILNDNEEIKELIQKTKENPQLGYNIFRYELNNIENIENYITENDIKLVITSDKIKNSPELLHKFYELLSLNVRFDNLPNFYEQILWKIPISIIGKIWFLENIKNLDRPLYNLFKRSLDIITSSILIIPTLIVYPIVAIATKLHDGGPVFYTQKRIGKDNKEFTLIKFRTMKLDSEKSGPKFTEKNDNRITKIGKLMRDTRIDELPQVINVLKGEMSLIGPRPERPEFVNQFSDQIPYYNFRHIVQPGLTGWAQVNYDYGASLEDAYKKLQYDLYYIKNKSLILDIATVLKTIQTVISRKGR